MSSLIFGILSWMACDWISPFETNSIAFGASPRKALTGTEETLDSFNRKKTEKHSPQALTTVNWWIRTKTLKRKNKTKESLKFCNTRLCNTEGNNATAQERKTGWATEKNAMGWRADEETDHKFCLWWETTTLKILPTLIKGYQYNTF